MDEKIKQINDLTEALIKAKYECYKVYLEILDDEFIEYEFCDRIGNECGDLEYTLSRKGISGLVEKLEDHMANLLYDDPQMDPINMEYKDACMKGVS